MVPDNGRRAIDFHDSDRLDETALKNLIGAANLPGKKKHQAPSRSGGDVVARRLAFHAAMRCAM